MKAHLITLVVILFPFLVFSQIDILENGNIGIGTLDPIHKIHMVGPVHSTGNFTIGSGGNGILSVRHINGKDYRNNNTGNLHFNWHNQRNVFIGRAKKGNLYVAGAAVIGYGGSGELKTRFINGKTGTGNAYDHLYLNWHSKKDVVIGSGNAGSLRVSGTAYSNWFRAQGNTGFFFQKWKGGFYMQDNTWIRIYNNKSLYQKSGRIRTDGTLQVGPDGSRFIVEGETVGINGALKIGRNGAGKYNGSRFIVIEDKVGIKTTNPVFNLAVNGSAGKTGGGDWATLSDKKVKKNINQFEDGLDEVLQINPVTFQYNGKAGIENTEKTYVGVIAQEIQKVAPYTVDKVTYEKTEEVEEDGELKTKTLSSEEFLQFDGTAIRYMLVNAIQEQQGMIEQQQKMLEEQQKTIKQLGQEVTKLKDIIVYDNGNLENQEIELANNISNKPLLFQNVPNPYGGITKVDYYLPENSSGLIRFYTLDGQMLKEEILNQSGYSSIEVDASKLPNGNFMYALIVDGNIVDSKTMVVVK